MKSRFSPSMDRNLRVGPGPECPRGYRRRRPVHLPELHPLLSHGGQARPRGARGGCDGNEFLEFAAGIAVVSTGHCHPEVVAAIQQQAAELIHSAAPISITNTW